MKFVSLKTTLNVKRKTLNKHPFYPVTQTYQLFFTVTVAQYECFVQKIYHCSSGSTVFRNSCVNVEQYLRQIFGTVFSECWYSIM